ncbi:MAG: 2-amino-4-hydroxy-6-hydroxymethyldihydropteridine diphosphokinase [Candidatus Melainabacteria bacterium]|nr:MAG: 2-amino-4-hydroxy-6-hydroxymethyldihydropteridine diphosphokinase [Candidatus Melainabacteria bacterium]
MAIVYLCLGSNQGDKVGYIQQATRLLSSHDEIKIIRTSSFYETQPWLEKDTDWFVNAVIELKTSLLPRELLKYGNEIESKLGRVRETEPENAGRRPIDIDILFYDSQIIEEEDFNVPHRFLHKRAFVLVPFLELNPKFVHPVFNKTIKQLYDELEKPEIVYLYGTRLKNE